jgi:glyceraldehyde-3-phosphate dehydrogenase type I
MKILKSLLTQKSIATVTAGAFFLTTIGAPLAEANFWSDRRKAARSMAQPAGGSSAPALANVAGLSGNLRITQGLDRAARLAPGIGFTPLQASSHLPKELLAALPPSLATLSSAYGDIESIKPAKGSSLPPVVLIQDAHGITSAQKNIANMLEGMGALSVVGIEGAQGPFNLKQYRDLPRQDVQRDINEFLLQNGLLNGSEYYGLMAAKEPLLWGVENDDLYTENVQAYRDSEDSMQSVLDLHRSLTAGLTSLKNRIYSKDLFALDKAYSDYSQGRLGAVVWVARLAEGRNLDGNRFPQSRRFLRANAMEQSLDFPAVERARARILRSLAEKLTPEQTKDLVELSVAYRAGALSHGAYYGRMKDLLARARVRLEDYSPFDKYVDYALTADQIDPSQLFNEMEDLKKETFHALARTEGQRTLAGLSDDLLRVEKLIRHELTPLEWAAYNARKGHGEGILPTARALAPLGLAAESIEQMDKLAKALPVFERFYLAADKRDAVLTGNFLAKIQSLPAPSRALPAVLICGGFHTPGLQAEMNKRGLSTVTLRPKIGDVKDGAKYLDLLSKTPTPLDKLLLGEKLMVNPTPGLAAKPSPAFPDAKQKIKAASDVLMSVAMGDVSNGNVMTNRATESGVTRANVTTPNGNNLIASVASAGTIIPPQPGEGDYAITGVGDRLAFRLALANAQLTAGIVLSRAKPLARRLYSQFKDWFVRNWTPQNWKTRGTASLVLIGVGVVMALYVYGFDTSHLLTEAGIGFVGIGATQSVGTTPAKEHTLRADPNNKNSVVEIARMLQLYVTDPNPAYAINAVENVNPKQLVDHLNGVSIKYSLLGRGSAVLEEGDKIAIQSQGKKFTINVLAAENETSSAFVPSTGSSLTENNLGALVTMTGLSPLTDLDVSMVGPLEGPVVREFAVNMGGAEASIRTRIDVSVGAAALVVKETLSDEELAEKIKSTLERKSDSLQVRWVGGEDQAGEREGNAQRGRPDISIYEASAQPLEGGGTLVRFLFLVDEDYARAERSLLDLKGRPALSGLAAPDLNGGETQPEPRRFSPNPDPRPATDDLKIPLEKPLSVGVHAVAGRIGYPLFVLGFSEDDLNISALNGRSLEEVMGSLMRDSVHPIGLPNSVENRNTAGYDHNQGVWIEVPVAEVDHAWLLKTANSVRFQNSEGAWGDSWNVEDEALFPVLAAKAYETLSIRLDDIPFDVKHETRTRKNVLGSEKGVRVISDDEESMAQAIADLRAGKIRSAVVKKGDKVFKRLDRALIAAGKVDPKNPRDVIFISGDGFRKDTASLPWGLLGVDVVFHAADNDLNENAASSPHLRAGAKQVIVTSPSKGTAPDYVYGVNHRLYRATQRIIAAASCTTNGVAPILHALDSRGFKILVVHDRTVHAATNSQSLAGGRVGKNAAADQPLPATTGLSKAFKGIMPHLAKLLKGTALRVPTPDVSLNDFTIVLEGRWEDGEVYRALKDAADSDLAGILEMTENTDAIFERTRSEMSRVLSNSIVTKTYFNPKSGEWQTQLSLRAWYDNEIGFVRQLFRLAGYVARKNEDFERRGFYNETHPFLTGVQTQKTETLREAASKAGEIESKAGDLVDVHSMAAIGVTAWANDLGDKRGKATKDVADSAASRLLARALNLVRWLLGVVKVGEGQRDEADGLDEDTGLVGAGFTDGFRNPEVDLGVDAVELTNGIVKYIIEGSVSIALYALKGSIRKMFDGYYDKYVVGPALKGAGLSVGNTPEKNIELAAGHLNKPVGDVTVALLFREAHVDHIARFVGAGMNVGGAEHSDELSNLIAAYNTYKDGKAKENLAALRAAYQILDSAVKSTGVLKVGNLTLLADGDVLPALALDLNGGKLDILAGRGGAAEAVFTAALARSAGGEMSARLVSVERLKEGTDFPSLFEEGGKFSKAEEKKLDEHKAQDLTQAITARDLVKRDDFVLVASAIKDVPWAGEGALKAPDVNLDNGTVTVQTLVVGASGKAEVHTRTYTTALPEILNRIEELKKNKDNNASALAGAYYDLGVFYLSFSHFDNASRAFQSAEQYGADEELTRQIQSARKALEGFRLLKTGLDSIGREVNDPLMPAFDALQEAVALSENSPDPRLALPDVVRVLSKLVVKRLLESADRHVQARATTNDFSQKVTELEAAMSDLMRAKNLDPRQKGLDEKIQVVSRLLANFRQAKLDETIRWVRLGQISANDEGGKLVADKRSTAGKRLQVGGLDDTYENQQMMRVKLLTTKGLKDFVQSIILDRTTLLNKLPDGSFLVEFLLRQGFVLGLKTDEGLEDDKEAQNAGVAGAKSAKDPELKALPGLLDQAVEKGLRFTKYRTTIPVLSARSFPDGKIPDAAKTAWGKNVRAQARVQAAEVLATQERGLFALMEPEVIHDASDGSPGTHGIAEAYEATTEALKIHFEELRQAGVDLTRMGLKTSMVLEGINSEEDNTPDTVAQWTVRALHAAVPPELPFIVFLSGGQKDHQEEKENRGGATKNLDAIIRLLNDPKQAGVLATVSSSFGRELQMPALTAGGQGFANVTAMQSTMLLTAARIKAANRGELAEFDKDPETWAKQEAWREAYAREAEKNAKDPSGLNTVLKGTVARMMQGITSANDESTPSAVKKFDDIDGRTGTSDDIEEMRQLFFETEDVEYSVRNVIVYERTLGDKTSDGQGNLVQEKLIKRGINLTGKTDNGLAPTGDKGWALPKPGALKRLPWVLMMFKQAGATATKWRVTVTVDEWTNEKEANVRENMRILAESAKMTQLVGMVPMVEPEILMGAAHTQAEAALVAEKTWKILVEELNKAGVDMEGTIVKTSPIPTGYKADEANRVGPAEVAYQSLKSMLKELPANLGGVKWLSGGLQDDEAMIYANEINRILADEALFQSARDAAALELEAEGRGERASEVRSLATSPWGVSTSYGRGLQREVLKVWNGKPENVAAAQKVYRFVTAMNLAARNGKMWEFLEENTENLESISWGYLGKVSAQAPAKVGKESSAILHRHAGNRAESAGRQALDRGDVNEALVLLTLARDHYQRLGSSKAETISNLNGEINRLLAYRKSGATASAAHSPLAAWMAALPGAWMGEFVEEFVHSSAVWSVNFVKFFLRQELLKAGVFIAGGPQWLQFSLFGVKFRFGQGGRSRTVIPYLAENPYGLLVPYLRGLPFLDWLAFASVSLANLIATVATIIQAHPASVWDWASLVLLDGGTMILFAVVLIVSGVMVVNHVVGAYRRPSSPDQVDDLYAIKMWVLHHWPGIKARLPANIFLAAQAARTEPGNHTGETDMEKFKNAGAGMVIIGHSEKRAQGFTSKDAPGQVKKSNKLGMVPVLAIGRPDGYTSGDITPTMVAEQLAIELAGLETQAIERLIIAYEPPAAIGAATAAGPESVHEVMVALLKMIKQKHPKVDTAKIRFLYGGSVSPQNLPGFLELKVGERYLIHGALVARASIDPEELEVMLGQMAETAKKDPNGPRRIFISNTKTLDQKGQERKIAETVRKYTMDGSFDVGVAPNTLDVDLTRDILLQVFDPFRHWINKILGLAGRLVEPVGDAAYSPVGNATQEAGPNYSLLQEKLEKMQSKAEADAVRLRMNVKAMTRAGILGTTGGETDIGVPMEVAQVLVENMAFDLLSSEKQGALLKVVGTEIDKLENTNDVDTLGGQSLVTALIGGKLLKDPYFADKYEESFADAYAEGYAKSHNNVQPGQTQKEAFISLYRSLASPKVKISASENIEDRSVRMMSFLELDVETDLASLSRAAKFVNGQKWKKGVSLPTVLFIPGRLQKNQLIQAIQGHIDRNPEMETLLKGLLFRIETGQIFLKNVYLDEEAGETINVKATLKELQTVYPNQGTDTNLPIEFMVSPDLWRNFDFTNLENIVSFILETISGVGLRITMTEDINAAVVAKKMRDLMA